MHTNELRALYQEDGLFRAICDDFAGRKKNQTVTKVHRLKQLLSEIGEQSSRSEIIAVFRQLECLGAGKLIFGRRGTESRFAWSVGTRSFGQIAQGKAEEVEQVPVNSPDETQESEIDTVVHHFVLREDFTLEVELPADLTPKEASRIGLFVSSLPME